MDDSGKPEEAAKLLEAARNEAISDLEKMIAAYSMAHHQTSKQYELNWLTASVRFALKISDIGVRSAIPSLYCMIAECYADLSNFEQANRYHELAEASRLTTPDSGPFYHGTKANLKAGDLLNPGGESNYQRDLKMNHIYFSGNQNSAALAASLAKGDGVERVYIVEPTGDFEADPNVTDQKFPGNLTRSYRSAHPLKISGELTGWKKQTPGERKRWREKLDHREGEIIN